MAPPKRKIRGLQNIRTLSGRENLALPPHKAYMRIACLEMEKARRGVERDSALGRVQNIETRFREIDMEKAEILASLTQPDAAGSSDPPTSLPAGQRPEEPGSVFNFRY